MKNRLFAVVAALLLLGSARGEGGNPSKAEANGPAQALGVAEGEAPQGRAFGTLAELNGKRVGIPSGKSRNMQAADG